jgi:predicted NUDIX family NTP pyrophosphohydrolase
LDLAWRRGSAEAALRMKDSDTELVLVTERLNGNEVDILVDSADKAAKEFKQLGGKIVMSPFDIAIGRCAIVQDPWRNRFVVLDMTKGPLRTDAKGSVTQ